MVLSWGADSFVIVDMFQYAVVFNALVEHVRCNPAAFYAVGAFFELALQPQDPIFSNVGQPLHAFDGGGEFIAFRR
jgi:hypothetical protein